MDYRVGVRGGEEMKGAWQCIVRLFVKKKLTTGVAEYAFASIFEHILPLENGIK